MDSTSLHHTQLIFKHFIKINYSYYYFIIYYQTKPKVYYRNEKKIPQIKTRVYISHY